jgi:hypothetical protein
MATTEKYRAFYLPTRPTDKYDLVDSRNKAKLPSGAILVIKMNHDGTREILSEKADRTTEEQICYSAASKHLEFKYDG